MRSSLKIALSLGAVALLPACATTTTPETGNPNPPPPRGYRVECRTTALPLYYRDAACVPVRAPVARERTVVRARG